MKIFKRLMISVAVALSLNITANAQLSPGMIDMMPSINATSINAITEARTRILSGNSAAIATSGCYNLFLKEVR